MSLSPFDSFQSRFVTYWISLVCYWHWHVKDAETLSYILTVQRSRKHEGEWPNKPGSQYQAWHNTLTPFLKKQGNTIDLYRSTCV